MRREQSDECECNLARVRSLVAYRGHVLVVQEADGAREWRLLAGDDGRRRLEEHESAEDRNAYRIEDDCQPDEEHRPSARRPELEFALVALHTDVLAQPALGAVLKGVAWPAREPPKGP